MLQFELQLEPTDVEKFSVFNTDLIYSLDELSESDRLTYLNMLDIIGDKRITITDTPNSNPIIIFRLNSFNHNSDMSISNDYLITTNNFLEYNETDRSSIINFIDLINRLNP